MRKIMRIVLFFALWIFSRVVFAQEEYANPVDGKIYVADWKTYQPEAGVKPQSGRIKNAGVRLLSTQAEFEKNTTAEELVKLIGFIQEALTKESEGRKESGEILLQIELRKQEQPNFKMSYQGELTEEHLQRFYDALKAIEYTTKESAVTLQVHFIIIDA
jgi:hypothetical protein